MGTDGARRPLRIAFIVGSFPSISETFIVSQIVGVVARGHHVDIFTTAERVTDWIPAEVAHYGLMDRTSKIYASRSRAMGALRVVGLMLLFGWRAPMVLLRTIAIATREGLNGSLLLMYAVLTLIRRHRPRYDVIHAQFGIYGPLALKLISVGAIQGAAVVTSFRGYDAAKNLPKDVGTYLDLFQRGHLFLAVSHTLAQRLIQAGCDPLKVRVHHSGISCGLLDYNERCTPEGAAIRIITVARLVEKKGIAYAIQAVARVVAEGRSVSYAIVGEGPLRAELERLIRVNRLEGRVELLGSKPHEEVLRLVAAAHILVAPSVTASDGDEEGIPNSVKEAMAMGVPVIATRHGGIPELVEDGKQGFLVPERDVDALYRRLVHVIDHPEVWPIVGRAARRKIEGEFDIEFLNDELVRLYHALAQTDKSAAT